jgi:hypothetical protein
VSSERLRDQLLAGAHHGCKSWQEVAAKLGKDERHLRAVRKTLLGEGHKIALVPDASPHIGSTFQSFLDEERRSHRDTDKDIVTPISRWPNVAAFDSSDFRDYDKVAAAQQPYVPHVSPMTRKLTRAECPDGSLILWASDIHIPIHNVIACDLMVECAERNGVKRTIAGGDILDFNCLSRHKKQARRMVEHSTLLEEVAPGRELLNWFGSKDTDYILGNHEGRLQSFIDENPIFHGSLLSNFAHVVDLPTSINVVPQGGEVRLGNLSARHTDAEFKGGSGGKYPAQRLLDLFPDQSTMGGHVHRISVARRTTTDENGIKRTHAAWTMGHMSNEHEHYEYMSTSPNWQTGFAMIRVYWEGDRPRWTVYQVEVLFDRHNRPYFEFGGHVYSAAKKVAA